MAGIYIHIPFCKSRCIYCAFYSTTDPSLRQRYVDAVCREMVIRGERREERLRVGEQSSGMRGERKEICGVESGSALLCPICHATPLLIMGERYGLSAIWWKSQGRFPMN